MAQMEDLIEDSEGALRGARLEEQQSQRLCVSKCFQLDLHLVIACDCLGICPTTDGYICNVGSGCLSSRGNPILSKLSEPNMFNYLAYLAMWVKGTSFQNQKDNCDPGSVGPRVALDDPVTLPPSYPRLAACFDVCRSLVCAGPFARWMGAMLVANVSHLSRFGRPMCGCTARLTVSLRITSLPLVIQARTSKAFGKSHLLLSLCINHPSQSPVLLERRHQVLMLVGWRLVDGLHSSLASVQHQWRDPCLQQDQQLLLVNSPLVLTSEHGRSSL